MFDDMMKFHENMQQKHALKYQEYERLRAECPKSVKEGQVVLVAVGLLGHGFHWIRKECKVLAVNGDNSKITFPSECSELHGKKYWEYWIPNCLITAILDNN